jgi:hypothetical protein
MALLIQADTVLLGKKMCAAACVLLNLEAQYPRFLAKQLATVPPVLLQLTYRHGAIEARSGRPGKARHGVYSEERKLISAGSASSMATPKFVNFLANS